MPAEPLTEKEAAEPGVAAVNRALTILQAFEHSVDGMTLTDLMKATGLYHSTILRLCESLEHYRYLKRLDDGRYMLGSTPFYLGMIYQAQFRLQDYVLPVLRELTKATHETSALYVRDGDARVCLHRVELPRRVRMNVPEGDRVELQRGAAGKVLLAFADEPGKAYDDIRAARHAVSQAERDSESAAIACPVFAGRQQLVGALSLGIPLYRFNKSKYAECLPLVMAAGRRLTSDLGGDPAFFDAPAVPLKGLKVPAG
ncbi:IclR family transcriptional regulator [Aquincola tertiaricarbonis]|uniref:IclR family transcriptional regulator n=1 Tax=Aquincola tertiaricarbonis TaxID=391953 RepID=UPI000614EB6D|nr:IclR family transcriptional regulator [Aquincola tertiaricarbonis]